MDFLTQLLSSQVVIILMMFGAVFIFIYALISFFNDIFDPVRSRFEGKKNTDAFLTIEAEKLSEKLRKLNIVYIPSGKDLLLRTRMRLHYAGFHGNTSLFFYYAIRTSLMILLPAIVILSAYFIPAIKLPSEIKGILIAFAIAYMGPSFILDKLIAIRQKNLRRAFPDALDLLVVCSEAGLSLDAALQKVATEMCISQPILAEELNVVINETRAGIERHKALQRLVERTGVEDIKGLVATLAQSMRFGTSIVESLKDFSEELRDKRTQAAEEMANKIGVKLVFPLGVCLLPAFLLIAMGPSVMIFRHLH